ncbi:MAG: VCBS repeat-containing protein [Chitinophagales bacterium]|nr:VCBS repeat-containing protein [Chitinophagales bacterium]
MKFFLMLLVWLPAAICHVAGQQSPLFAPVPVSQSNIGFKNQLTESVDLNIITYEYFFNGGGVAAGDINNDGLIDLYFTGNMVPDKLYLNKGNLQFEDITNSAGVGGHDGWKTGVTMADVNGDGWLDIYVCYSGKDSLHRNNQLFINQHNLTFKDEAKERNLAFHDYSTQAAFLDYDRDGDLDIYLLNHNIKFFRRLDASAMKSQRDANAGDRLLRNDDGKFTDVTVQAGISGNPISFGLGVAVADFNRDGWPDIYVSNDYTEQDYCYINNGNGTFSDRLEAMMGHVSQFSMGNDAADFNNDGLTDLMTLDMLPPDNYRQKLFFVPDNYEVYQSMVDNRFYHQLMRNMLQLNNGDGTFSEIGQLAGVSNTDWSWAPLFADFDNDGWKDLLITNGYLRDMINMDFQKFYADERLKASSGQRNEKILQMLQLVPSTPLHNFLFRNNGDLTFTDVSAGWGLGEKNFSNGAAFADLDNDGDLDIIINKLNETAVVYQNTQQGSNFLDITFSDQSHPNRFGIGASATVYEQGKKQFAEFYPSRGFQSGMHVPLHFGLKNAVADSVIIIWPDGKKQKMTAVSSNQRLVAKYEDALEKWQPPVHRSGDEWLQRNPPSIRYLNEEDKYNDFKQQPLMPNMISFCGPRCAAGDVNGDGLTDYYLCGAKNKPGKLFIQSPNGSFNESRQPAFERDMAKHDADAIFFDADRDGDQDLYVVSGGYQLNAGDTLLQDRLYFNNGGTFMRMRAAMPEETASGACVKAADIDGDGDLDLFVGGRVVPGRYPQAPKSFVLLNDGKGNFENATNHISPALENIGMVTDAVWLDLNRDRRPDLILCGEWMPVKIFINKNGQLIDESEKYLPEKSSGWWNRIFVDDFDGDGDSDLVIGNTGLNFQFKVSDEKPAKLLYADFDGNGSMDPFIFAYVQDSLWPLASRDEALDQMISLRKKFTEYKSYARTSMKDLLTPDQIAQAGMLNAVRFQTSYFENKGDHFEYRELPVEAQFAPVFAIASFDFDADGKKDLFLGGNMQHVRIRFGKSDANYGTLLKGDGYGGFTYISQRESGLNIRGDVRDAFVMHTPAGDFLTITVNQQPLQMYRIGKK